MLFISSVSYSQFELEHTFTAYSLQSSLIEGEKVFLEYYDLPDSTGYVIWDTDYSWVGTIDHSGIGENDWQYVHFISRYIFDDDDGIEYILEESGGGGNNVHIVNLDGPIIHTFPNRALAGNGGLCEPGCSILNVGDHAILRLKVPATFSNPIHALPGLAHCCQCDSEPEIPALGCTYPDADNYDPLAEQDDQTCIFDSCLGDFNNNQVIDTLDLLEFLSVFGATCG